MYRKPLVTIVILLALALVGSAAALGEGPPAVNTYTGTLTVVVGDPMPVAGEPMTPLPPIFTLNLADGRELRLLPGAAGENDLLRLAGQQVSVTLPAAEAEFALVADDPAAAGVPVTSVALAPGAVMVSPEVSGNTKWLSIACKFADIADEPQPLSYFSGMYSDEYPGLNHYWREASYGAMDLTGSTAVGWYTLPHPRSYYMVDENYAKISEIAYDCAIQADPDVFLPDYYGLNIFLNASIGCCDWTTVEYWSFDGVIYRPYNLSLFGGPGYGRYYWYTNEVLLHEMGHQMVWPHSWAGNNPYGNVWDVVSGLRYNCDQEQFIHPVYGCLGQHTIAQNRMRAGWIPSERIYTAGPGRHTITLEQTAQPGPDGYLIAVVPVNGSATHYYTIEARRRVGYDVKLPGDAIIIHETTDAFNMKLIDPSGWSHGDGPSAMWVPGEAFGSAETGVLIRVDAATASGFSVTIYNGGTQPRQKVVAPTADTYVQQNMPTTNFGSAVTLKVNGATPVGLIGLKFDPAAIPPGAYRLRLRMALAADPGAATLGSVYDMWPPHCHRTGSWSESTLVWNDFVWGNCQNNVIAQTQTRDGSWVEWDVTGGAFHYGVENLMLINSSGWVTYSSKEGPNPPQLIIEYLVPPDEPTTHTFTPTNDATVNQAKPKLISGSKPTLQVKDAAKDLNAYVKFNVTSLDGAVRSATLRLWATNGGPDGGRVYATSPFYPGTTTQWLETGLKWSNAPAISGAPLDAAGAVAAKHWIELDVTAAITGNGRASFALTNDATDLVVYSSKEGAHAPELVIVTD